MPRNDETAQKMAIRIQRIHGHRRTHHYCNQGTLWSLLQHMVTRANHGNPAICPQTRRVVIAIADTRLLQGGNNPLRLKVPADHLLDLLMHPAPGGFPCYHTAQHALRCRQACPGAFRQTLNMLQEFRSVSQQGGPGPVIFVHGPLQTSVANVYGQKCHAADYQYF